MYNIWSFLFAHFRKSDTVGPFKSALWEAVHFPLHFGILLVLAALIVSLSATRLTAERDHHAELDHGG